MDTNHPMPAAPRDAFLDLCGAVGEVALAVKDLNGGLRDHAIGLEKFQAGRSEEAERLLSNASIRFRKANESADFALNRVVALFRKFGNDA